MAADTLVAVTPVPSGEPEGTGISRRLWEDSLDLAEAALKHPFVLQLADGTLPKPVFQYYIVQDSHYLKAFARAYALALTKCVDVGEDVFDTIAKFLRGVNTEMALHRSYAASWGIDLMSHRPPSGVTAAYTGFLLEVADNDDTGVCEVLTAMLPCARLYAFLGCQLARREGGVDPTYSAWVNNYSKQSFLDVPNATEAIVDVLGEKVPYERLLHLYQSAMQLELDFFSQQPDTAVLQPPAA